MKTDSIKIKPRWSKSKEQIWEERFAELEDNPKTDRSLFRRRIGMWVTMAAVMLILVLPLGAWLYTKDVYVPKGEHQLLKLPDGSMVTVNADSYMSYKPLWWKVSRKVTMKGEAFFEVAKGSTFRVVSPKGVVSVMGTSFNVFDRERSYRVVCLTGKVKVQKARSQAELTPGMEAQLENGAVTVSEVKEPLQTIEWTQNRFSFQAVPLVDVLEEIERQYDIKISSMAELDYLYSGSFIKHENPAVTLEIVGKPFGLNFKIE